MLCLAALTMNLGMTDLQDKLAQQLPPPTPEQRKQIESHPERLIAMLQKIGVTDTAWLEAIRFHHNVPSGPLAAKTEGQRMAHLIQPADMFAARPCRRATSTKTGTWTRPAPR